MIKYDCDKCGEEFKPNRYFAEVKIIQVKDILLPKQKGRQVMAQETTRSLKHICPSCMLKFEDWLKG